MASKVMPEAEHHPAPVNDRAAGDHRVAQSSTELRAVTNARSWLEDSTRELPIIHEQKGFKTLRRARTEGGTRPSKRARFLEAKQYLFSLRKG